MVRNVYFLDYTPTKTVNFYEYCTSVNKKNKVHRRKFVENDILNDIIEVNINNLLKNI